MSKQLGLSSMKFVLRSLISQFATHNLQISCKWLRAYYTPAQWRRVCDILTLLGELGLIIKRDGIIVVDQLFLDLYGNTFETQYIPPLFGDIIDPFEKDLL